MSQVIHEPWKLCANCIYVSVCAVSDGFLCLIWRAPSAVTGTILTRQVLVSLKSGRVLWGWRLVHSHPLNSDCGNLEEPDLPNVPLLFGAFLLKRSWTMPFSFLEAFQLFQSFFPLEILEPQHLEVFSSALLYLLLTGFIQKSAVHKLFITHPVHEFNFLFNFYECFLC